MKIKLKMKNYNMILIERLRKYKPYQQVKLINTNTLLVKKLPSNQQQIIQQAKFNYSPLGKTLEKQRKTIEDQGEKQVDALKASYKKLPSIKDFVPTEKFNLEIINEIKRIEEIDKNVVRDKMVYKSTSKTYDFRNFKTIRTYGNDIRNNVISLAAANLEQANLLARFYDFVKKTQKTARS